MMKNVGPSATILWAGPDIDVVEVSAHDALPDLSERYKLAERRLMLDLGIPSMLLSGDTNDKQSAYTAAITLSGMLKEIQNQYAQALRSIAELIAEQNGFQEVDVVWEWKRNILDDPQAAATLIVQLFSTGLVSTQTALEELGLDYDAEVARQQADVANGYKDQPFGPPAGAVLPNPGGVGGDTGGRPAKTGQKDPRTNKEQTQYSTDPGAPKNQ
jgi:hypothetical protein